jgi:hypothetical protein
MFEADRVFARMSTPESHSSPKDRQYIQIAPRRRGVTTGHSRVVEVVHRRSDRSADAPREERSSAHAASWPEGFQARSASVPPPAEMPAASPVPAPPVGHVMPGWEPLLAPMELPSPPVPPQRQPKAVVAPKPRERGFADPFAAEDTGANCFRCGYLVEPAREKRGLMICAACG